MNRKARMALGNGMIIATTLVGGALLTNSLTASSGGLMGLFGSTGSTATTAGNTSTDKTVTGDSIAYRYGNVQVEVVRTGGKLTAINMKQADATAGREVVFPMLVEAALASQNANVANISGATFSVEAFKQALNSAISKLG